RVNNALLTESARRAGVPPPTTTVPCTVAGSATGADDEGDAITDEAGAGEDGPVDAGVD
ncbi:MAG: hypothetical protein QOJ62_2162, partial [Actinomycetota bacterium]|nr:hypothetical protein [Actinomycetota bacterium]